MGGKEVTCQCRRHKRCGFDPWAGKIPWNKKWQPTKTKAWKQWRACEVGTTYPPPPARPLCPAPLSTCQGRGDGSVITEPCDPVWTWSQHCQVVPDLRAPSSVHAAGPLSATRYMDGSPTSPVVWGGPLSPKVRFRGKWEPLHTVNQDVFWFLSAFVPVHREPSEPAGKEHP